MTGLEGLTKGQSLISDLFRERQVAAGIEPLVVERASQGDPYREYSRPGKVVVYIGARGFGGEVKDFYDNPHRYFLVGTDYHDMHHRCAIAWEWQCGEELDRFISVLYAWAKPPYEPWPDDHPGSFATYARNHPSTAPESTP